MRPGRAPRRFPARPGSLSCWLTGVLLPRPMNGTALSDRTALPDRTACTSHVCPDHGWVGCRTDDLSSESRSRYPDTGLRPCRDERDASVLQAAEICGLDGRSCWRRCRHYQCQAVRFRRRSRSPSCSGAVLASAQAMVSCGPRPVERQRTRSRIASAARALGFMPAGRSRASAPATAVRCFSHAPTHCHPATFSIIGRSHCGPGPRLANRSSRVRRSSCAPCRWRAPRPWPSSRRRRGRSSGGSRT